ncbi:hypothetical protein Taro_045815, partial [Colocasia esculenta]|nr:hypothetical protein [Colocasia esculenta]
VSVALLCTGLIAWLARASVSPACVLDCASTCALEAFHVVILVFGLSIGRDRGGASCSCAPGSRRGFRSPCGKVGALCFCVLRVGAGVACCALSGLQFLACGFWRTSGEGSSQLAVNDALVVLVEVLPGPACVASAALLAAVFSLMVYVFNCLDVHSGEGSSQDRPLSLLVEVLPRSALCLFWATVVLPLWFEVCRLVGLRSGEVLPGRLLVLLVEVLPKAASDELSLLPVELSMLQSAWALSIKGWGRRGLLCPLRLAIPCVWLLADLW